MLSKRNPLSFIPRWAQASVLVMVLSLSGKVLGLWRELETARLFGVGAAMDAFIAASTLLFFVARMASDSLLVSTPGLIKEYDAQQTPIPWSNLFRSVLLLSTILTILALIVLPPLVPVLFAGLSQSAQQLTTQLIKKMLPLITGWTIIGALGGILNTQHRYGRYQVALIAANASVLISLWLLAQHIGINALAWGWTIGIWFGVLIIVRSLWQQRQQIDNWQGWGAQWLMLRRMLAGTGGLSLWFLLNQIPLWIERYYAAQLPTGSLSALGYAQRLFQLPLGIVTTVIMNVWVARVAAMPIDRIVRQTFRLTRSLAVVTFPIAFVLALLAQSVVTLVYARGAFDTQAVLMTTGPFAMYALGLGFHTLSAVFVRTFQARGLVRYPLLAVAVDILLTSMLNHYSFQRGWGATGIAAVNTVVASMRVLMLGSINHFLKA